MRLVAEWFDLKRFALECLVHPKQASASGNGSPLNGKLRKSEKKKIKEFQKANAQPVFWIQFGVPVSCSVQIFG